MSSDKEIVRNGYVDGIDLEYHMGFDKKGVKVYPDVASCLKDNPCIHAGGCGLAEVEVKFIRWVYEPTYLQHNLDKS